MTVCPLCDKLTKLTELPDGDVVWQFPHSVAFLGPWQYFTGYCVLVARTHVAEMHRLPAPERPAFLEEMIVLAHAIDLAFKPRKLNCESLGNQVAHPHWHLFPRSADDPDTLKAVWIALDRAERDESEKQRLQTAPLPRPEISAWLRSALQQLEAPTS
jgi:diadenosine tetraphosphate (Ap4A) HIT family hydrolase